METNISLASCLICGVDNWQSSKVSRDKCSKLCRHLHVIFLLRNVLEVPLDKLISYLGSSPNVQSWISVCDKCEQMVDKCKQIYETILTAQKEFGIVKQEIIETLKESPVVKLEEDEDDSVIDIDLQILEEIREYVYCNEYAEITNPFISGDRLAHQKLSKVLHVDKTKDEDDNLFRSSSPTIKIEDDDENDKEGKPFLKIKNATMATSSTTATAISTAANVEEVTPSVHVRRVESPISLLIDYEEDKDGYLVDTDSDDDNDENEEEEQLVNVDEQKEKEELIMETPRSGVNLEDPWSLPMTIDLLDSDSEDPDEQDDDDDEDFDPDDESVDIGMDMDSDEEYGVDQVDHDDDDVSDENEDGADQGQEDDDQEDKGPLIQNEKPPKRKTSCRPRPGLKFPYPKPIYYLNDNVDTFSCPICHKKYPTHADCNSHIRHLHFARTKYICNLCGSTTDGQEKLQKHQKICTGVSYLCPLAPKCLRRFYKVQSLRLHLRDTHAKADEASLPPKIQKMLRKMREQNTKICGICGKTFATAQCCLRHREYIHEKKWKCGRCGVVKWTKGDLGKHEEICGGGGGGKVWTCPVEGCGLVFGEFRAITVHLGTIHKGHGKIEMREEDRPIVICEGCGATFKRKFRLNEHHKYSVRCRLIRGLEPLPKRARGERVICQVCGKGYPNGSALGCHVRRVHEKRFSKWCGRCGKGCAGERDLRKHLFWVHKVGEGEERWRCEVEGCGVQICSEKKREEHMRQRHGERERRWGCGVCGRRYLHERSLIQHKKEVHVEGKTYKKKKKVEIENEEIISGGGGVGGDVINCELSELLNIQILK